MSSDPIRPLHDVWLRPRRVFRELAAAPIGAMDYLLGAAQGVVGLLAWSRAQNEGDTSSLAAIFGRAFVVGSIAGVLSLLLMGVIYARLGRRVGGASARNQVFHVLAYGGIPMAVSLFTWILTALLAGGTAFVQVPRPDVEAFVVILLRVHFAVYVLLTLWTVVIQVMGLSEIQGLAVRKAFGLWVLGQVVGFLALVFLMILIALLFPGAVTT